MNRANCQLDRLLGQVDHLVAVDRGLRPLELAAVVPIASEPQDARSIDFEQNRTGTGVSKAADEDLRVPRAKRPFAPTSRWTDVCCDLVVRLPETSLIVEVRQRRCRSAPTSS